MLDRTVEQFDIQPSRLIADAGYGLAEMLGWLVDERGIEPHVKVFDKSERSDGTFSRSEFAFDPERNLYLCPGGKELKKYHRNFSKAARRPDEGWHAPLLREKARLQRMPAQAEMLPERAGTQNWPLHS